MNWHRLIDERSSEFERVVVFRLRRDPSQLAPVERWIRDRLATILIIPSSPKMA